MRCSVWLADASACVLRSSLAVLRPEQVPAAEKAKDKAEFLRIVEEQRCVHVYDAVCAQLGWPVDTALRSRMKEQNDATLKAFEEKIKDAEENLGENEVREALLEKANFLARVGDKALAIEAYAVTEAHPKTTTGQKMDIVFSVLRIGLFWDDLDIVQKNIEKAKVLIEAGGDWERRNRLKVYEAIFNILIRNFKDAALLLLDSIATFSAYELFDYEQFIFYAVATSIVALDRKTLKARVIDAPEVLQVRRWGRGEGACRRPRWPVCGGAPHLTRAMHGAWRVCS